ncbi:uncharacterized protein PWA37_003690 [Arxiozyma heterogenica]|uniref:uncharacterized protein n=1 Tax=Arxiozyma heterogenica TaxID=278026 RepID=UPI002F1DF6AF
MASLYKVSEDTKKTIQKFRISTSRSEKIKCLPIKIEPSPSYAIVVDREEQEELDEDLNELGDLSEILPDNAPRFVLTAYPLTNKDGIKQTPLILLYWKPLTVVSSEWKMLYAGALEMVKNLCGPSKTIEITSGLEDDDEVEELGKGISSSAIPYSRNAPAWFKLSSEAVVEQIIKYARKGLTPSQIGVLLRDAHGVTQAKIITGNKIMRILKSNGLAPEIPEDLYFLIKKAVSVRKHLERNRKDKDAKFRLILIESRIHRLARYYRKVAVLPPNWKYESATASALVN